MKPKKLLAFGFVVLAIALLLAPWPVGLTAQQNNSAPVRIDSDDIGGVVTSANGPEAGVWVIAETTDLPTKFVKIVVTDDQGRYVVPDLPKANYSVWVRGYGLVDSPKVQTTPGKILNLTAVVAPNPRAAAEYYPAGHWFSLIRVPANGADRVAAGGVPPGPPRPRGLERNVVITQWDWADAKAYLHDEVSTDRRNPTINANGPIYGSLELSADYLPVLDPVRHTASQVRLTVRDSKTQPAAEAMMLQPS